MSELSLVIRNARIVDGTGAPAFAGAIGIAGDRIAEVGAVPGAGAVEIDAGGRVAAPGFIDIHTHYDPQLCWDRLANPSPEHGVTTLVMGNCSIGLAPVRPADRGRLIQLFGSVEDMEGRLLESTVPFQWETVPEYLAWLGRDLGPNVGVLIGHSVLRLYAMGAASQERAATDAEIEAMCALLREAMAAGAFGLSYTYAHLDECGRPLPCEFADRRERLALMRVLAEAGRGVVEVAPRLSRRREADAQIDDFGSLALETGVKCTLNAILQSPATGTRWRELLARVNGWRARGAPLYAQVQTRPLDMTVELAKGSALFSKCPTWRRALDLPIADRVATFADRSLRAQLQSELRPYQKVLDQFTVRQVKSGANARYLGARVAEVAERESRSYTDVLLDIAVADDLQTQFSVTDYMHADVDAVGVLLDHPAVHIGAGDAGAHITQFAGVGDTCYLFEQFVRKHRVLSLERAVQRLTGEIARDWCIADRGVLVPGRYADVVLFDPDTIARGEEQWVDDVPGGNGRYVRRPQGVECTIVNGQVVVDRGRYTAARPGRII
ncbi:MAG: amidohydrolase family protein [Gammaproteobacteria bacterium]